MNKLMILLLLLGGDFCFSQVTDLEIITTDNDTIRNISFKSQLYSDPKVRYDFQDEIVYVKGNSIITLLPSEVKSFSFKYNNDIVAYESMDGVLFAVVLHSNKLKLLRFLHRSYTPVDIYVVKRPNEGKISYLEAMGLSRRISKKIIKREMTDCPATIAKVENRILKIHGESGVIELVQDYESSCF